MQFINGGPDIPNALLQAHEDGHVVFFCGAGISYPAGLPGFKGLVDSIYTSTGTTCSNVEKVAYENNKFDAVLSLLEKRLPGGQVRVRSAIKEILQPNLQSDGAIDTHSNLLRLAHTREGVLRLVTTNFDRIFEHLATQFEPLINTYEAPMLPIPKNSRWNGLVYLHGLLPVGLDENKLKQLVVTSGDFGLAYLTERWASRFVSELFRNYVVCFIGYSIDDPVLRYMMDALAVNRLQGEVTPEAYALVNYSHGEAQDKTIEWGAKGVTPILYEVPSDSNDHSTLHQTLKVWAETYRDGVLGKERIVVDLALANPSDSSQQDDFVGRMLWALSHDSGLPAKRFAELNPVPTLGWLVAFAKNRYDTSDLAFFDLSPSSEVGDEFKFSLICRPASTSRASWMSLATGRAEHRQWDNIMFHLARWLVRHLNDPALILWVAKQGGQLHERWASMITEELNHLVALERKGETQELELIRTNSPNAIPDPKMQKLWSILLAGRVKSARGNFDLFSWGNRLKHHGLTTTLRFELRKLLAPKVTFKEPFRWSISGETNDEPGREKKLVDWEVALAADHVQSSLQSLTSENWHKAVPELLGEFQQLLLDALDLFRELGDADDRSDRSHWDIPSITPHWQNRGFQDWVRLIELLRDAWQAIHNSEPERATRIAQSWFDLPYPAFKRLALFAASQDGCIETDQWLSWLSADSAWWLWSIHTRREAMRLLVLQGAEISPAHHAELEKAILKGPPCSMYQPEAKSDSWKSMVDHSVWLRLSKLQSVNKLSDYALRRFDKLSKKYPKWVLADNESDEFSHWMSGTGDPDYEVNRDIDITPRKRSELVKWLKQSPPKKVPFDGDTWRDTCRTRFFHSICALCDLAKEDLWPEKRWEGALYAWGEEDVVLRSWRFGAALVKSMPEKVFQEISHAVAWWLEAVSKQVVEEPAILFDLLSRILALKHQDDMDPEQPVIRAINHPVGQATRTLLNLWFKQEPNDDDGLPVDIRRAFTQLCDVEIEQYRHGRVVLASSLVALFRVDRDWSEKHLLPLFNWSTDPVEAKAVWEGFLWSPRLYRPLLIAFKPQFLETAEHYGDLGEHSHQFSTFLTYVALEKLNGYTTQEFSMAFQSLPPKALVESAQALVQALEGAGEQREDYWKNRTQPFWHHIWPKSHKLATKEMSESLASLSIAANGEFPDAVSVLKDWLQLIEHPYSIVAELHESGLVKRFPEAALVFLDAIIRDQQWWGPGNLNQCLMAVSGADKSMETDSRYRRLLEYSRVHNV